MAKKNYENRQIVTDRGEKDEVFFFPKHNPPVSIRAKSRDEAEEKLAALNSKEA